MIWQVHAGSVTVFKITMVPDCNAVQWWQWQQARNLDVFQTRQAPRLPFRFWFPCVENERGVHKSTQKKDVMMMIVSSPWGLKQLQGDAAYTNKQFRALEAACNPSLPLKTFP